MTTSPRSIGRYAVLEELGRGAVGVVYRVRDPAAGTGRALKLLTVDARSHPRAHRRFLREAQLLSDLDHPGIVGVHDWGADDRGRPYLVMDLVEGGSLARRLQLEGPLPAREAARLVARAARALAAAHEAGVVHRDVTPANVLLGPAGPVLTDFGLAKELVVEAGAGVGTAEGVTLGTIGYAAPEQLQDARRAGPPADVFGLGATLYTALVARRPFAGAGLTEVLYATINGRWELPSRLRRDLPGALDAICARCLATDPARRYASAEALAQDLERFVAGQRPRALDASSEDLQETTDVFGALMEEPLEPSAPDTRASAPEPDDWGAVPAPPPDLDLSTADTALERPPDDPDPEDPADVEGAATAAPPAGDGAAGEETTAELPATELPTPAPTEEDAQALEDTSLQAALRPPAGAVEETVIQAAPDAARAFGARGRACFAEGDVVGAIQAFDQALAFAPDDVDVLVMRGVARRRSGNLRGALEDFDRALRNDPDDGRALVSRGVARMQHRDFAGAADDLSRALALLPPGDPRAPRVLTQLERAREQLGSSVIRGRRLRP